jgi:hypothetical protein
MWVWEDGVVVTAASRQHTPRRITTMKKIMSLMLGLTLFVGAVTVAFAQDKKDDTTDTTKKKKKKKKADDTK